MLDRTLKSLLAVMALAGALAAESSATTTIATKRSDSGLAARTAEPAPRRHPHGRPSDEGCLEPPSLPTPVPVVSCSAAPGTAP
jgi:hypothetical protein